MRTETDFLDFPAILLQYVTLLQRSKKASASADLDTSAIAGDTLVNIALDEADKLTKIR